MKIYVDSQIRIENPTKEIIQFIKNELEIPNPEIAKKTAMGFWCGNIPKTLKAYSKKGNDYIIPLGEIDNIWKLHPINEDYSVFFGLHNRQFYPEYNLKLYDYQEKAVQEAIRFKRGILSSKCRFRQINNGTRNN